MDFREVKAEVVHGMTIRLTFDGAFQRAKIYKKNVSDTQRKEFRNSIEVLLPKYLNLIRIRRKYTDRDHYKIIERFAKEVSRRHPTILDKNSLRIGNAQKFLNLYWKVCWLLQKEIPVPIHCPFDSIIMKKLPTIVRVKWTEFNTIDEYKSLVKAVRSKIGNDNSIAEWELRIYREAIKSKS